MTHKVIREASRSAKCMVYKSRFLKQRPNKKSSWNNTNLKLFMY